jgi:DNA-binding CsgD family transcriptional regulator
MIAKTEITQSSISELIQHQFNLSHVLASVAGIKEALQASLDHSLYTTGMECGLIYLLHESEKDLYPFVYYGFEDDPMQMISQILMQTAKDRKLSQDIFPDVVNSILADNFPSLITLPLNAENKLFGWIGLASRRSITLAEPTHMHLQTISALLGNTIYRILLHTELKIKEESLKMKERKLDHLNTTLDTLLEKRKKDSLMLEQSLVFNIKEMILPDIVKIRHTGLADKQNKLLDAVEMNLNEITSKFIHSLSVRQLGLSPTELKIAAYVKQGRSTKEIATLLHTSEKTVKNQRLRIRKKLGICSKKINLRTYLASLDQSA